MRKPKHVTRTNPALSALEKLHAAGKLFYVPPEHLHIHPRNMRRTYPPDQVQEMADSIRGVGLIHPLRVVPNSRKGDFYVEDGNLRLTAARALGADCPPLMCVLVDDDRPGQLLRMAASTIRFDPDPISEAQHYKRLIEIEHVDVDAIAQLTGKRPTLIQARLALLELEPEIQDLMASRDLPCDARVVRALRTIPDATARVKLAQRCGRAGVSIKEIELAAARLSEQLSRAGAGVQPTKPAAIAGTAPNLELVPSLELGQRKAHADPPERAGNLREAARSTCQACEIRAETLGDVAEPAWELVSHAAEDTCNTCNMKDVRSACAMCPGVEIIRRLILLAVIPAKGAPNGKPSATNGH